MVVSETRGTEYKTSRDSSKCMLRGQRESTYLNQAKVLVHSLRSRVENAREAMRAGRQFDTGHQKAIAVDIEVRRPGVYGLGGFGALGWQARKIEPDAARVHTGAP